VVVHAGSVGNGCAPSGFGARQGAAPHAEIVSSGNMAGKPIDPELLRATQSIPLRRMLRGGRILQLPRGRRSENPLPANPSRSSLSAHSANFVGYGAAVTVVLGRGAENPIPRRAADWQLPRSSRTPSNR